MTKQIYGGTDVCVKRVSTNQMSSDTCLPLIETTKLLVKHIRLISDYISSNDTETARAQFNQLAAMVKDIRLQLS
jgi:hypothetical protein